MRERGVQSRRVRESKEAARRAGPAPAGTNTWQIIAIIALLAATAGWTTVAVMALRGPAQPAAAVASPSEEPTETEPIDEESPPTVADMHLFPELEAALPAAVDGVELQVQSYSGTEILTDDEWSTTVTTFLAGVGKTKADLQIAEADPTDALDASIRAYSVPGADAAKLRDTLIAAWKVDFPDLVVTDVTIGGQPMKRIVFDAETPASHLYVRGDNVYDIWTNDEAIVESTLAALPAPGASGAPAPSASAAPSAPASVAP